MCSFWDEKSAALRYIDFWKQAIEFNGYKPEEILYEPYKNFYTYEQFVDPNYVAGESPDVTSKKFDLSVGDTVKFKWVEMYGVILSISGGGQARVQITRPFPGGGGEIGDVFEYPLYGLEKAPSDKTEELIAPILDKKTDVFIEKRVELHTKAASLTPQQKQNLQFEVDTLELEIKKLQSFIDGGITTLNDDRKKELEQYVKNHVEKNYRYSYYMAQAEKQYGMHYLQIRQKYRGIPLDQLVKKESLYKKMMKQQIIF